MPFYDNTPAEALEKIDKSLPKRKNWKPKEHSSDGQMDMVLETTLQHLDVRL